MTIEIIAFSVLVFIVLLLAFNVVRLKLRNKKLVLQNVQVMLDRDIIVNKLKEEIEKRNNAEIEQTDGFLKFISDSRDWAFKYIEDVQAELLKFKSVIEPKVQYSNKYIKSTGESVATKIIDEIFEAYEDLKKIMPEDVSNGK